MDFWEQQALLESDNKIRDAHHYTLSSISRIQRDIIHCIDRIDINVRINFTRPDHKNVYNHLLHSRSSTPLISIDEIPERMSNDSEQRLYNSIQKCINEFNKSNKYLSVQGSAGDYSIKANNDFYTIFNSNVVRRESVNDFFEEEAVRLNEGLLHRLNPIADHEFEKAAKLNKKEIDFIVIEARKFEKFMMDAIEDPANGDENGSGTEISYIEKYIRTNYPSPLSSSNYFGFTDSYKVFKKLKDYAEKNKLTKAYNDKNHFYIHLEKNTADQDDDGGSGYAAYCIVDVKWFKNTLKNK